MTRPVLLTSRDVPLGGVRGLRVQRALPQRAVPTVGAWCFLDYFGPTLDVMRVLPHPHIGLQTVTWTFEGPIRHRDSLGSDVVLRPGELNLMTSGGGVVHSEFSVGDAPAPMQGVQLWVALPEDRRHGSSDFEHHEDLPTVEGAGYVATVFMGTWCGVGSPATTYTPMVGADLHMTQGISVLALDSGFEHALFVAEGSVTVGGVAVGATELVYLEPGPTRIDVEVPDTARVMLLGGEPFDDDLVMWWNFVARTHEEIVEARDAWEARSERFGLVDGHGDARIPAPPLPEVRLTPRRRRLEP